MHFLMPRALEEYSFLKISYPIWMSLVPHLYTLYFTTISLVFVRVSRRVVAVVPA